MHSKTQYLVSALLWDTLLSEKYKGLNATALVNMLFGRSRIVGVPDDFYDYASGTENGDELFQAQMRKLMDDLVRRHEISLRPQDEFQLLGNDGKTSSWAGASQLAMMHDGIEHIFSLNMDGDLLRFDIVANTARVSPVGRLVFRLELIPATEGFYKTVLIAEKHMLPFSKQIETIMNGLPPKGSTAEFQAVLYRWANQVRYLRTETIDIPRTEPPTAGTITIG